jgi:hypothetical protein
MFSSLAIFLLAAWFTFWRMSKSEERKERRYFSKKQTAKRNKEESEKRILRTFEQCKDNILNDRSIDEHERQKKLEELQAWYQSMLEEIKKRQKFEENFNPYQ